MVNLMKWDGKKQLVLMERKSDSKEEEEREEEEEAYNYSEDDEENDINILKTQISCHALYGSLIESHFNCLKLCCNNLDAMENIIDPIGIGCDNNQLNSSRQPELDQFMEAYCITLNKLKESMEEPQQESMAFINYMYSQLNDLVEIPSSPTLSPAKSSK